MDFQYPNLDDIPRIFSKYPSVQAVYLFGSYATGKIRRDSDLDLAIVPRDSSARQQMLDMLADLVRQVYHRIDLVFLDTKDVVVRFEAIRHNRLLYCVPDFDPGTYTSRIVRDYWDFKPHLAVQRQSLKQRILSHGAR
ncbi:MAG: nucleotidyltransferase domain-containing protein [Anaerolineales bacterium]